MKIVAPPGPIRQMMNHVYVETTPHDVIPRGHDVTPQEVAGITTTTMKTMKIRKIQDGALSGNVTRDAVQPPIANKLQPTTRTTTNRTRETGRIFPTQGGVEAPPARTGETQEKTLPADQRRPVDKNVPTPPPTLISARNIPDTQTNAESENEQGTMDLDTELGEWKNPVDKCNLTGPKIDIGTSPVLNKHEKDYQPLISAFFPTKTHLDNATRLSNKLQVETKNRFSSLIDECTSSLSTLDNVVNLSDKVLTDQELRILNKGLNFCPTPGDPEYHRLLRIQCWLNKKPNNLSGPYHDKKSLKLESKSTWNPPAGPPNLEYIIASNETGLLTTLPRRKHIATNTSRSDSKCISDLAKDTNIAIKKADKGGAVVLLN